MKNLFTKQLDDHGVVTEEMLKNIKIKTYKNGDEIKVGDKVLYAFLTDMSEKDIPRYSNMPMERSEDPREIKVELITLNENQFDLYTYDDILQDKTHKNQLPVIRIK